MENAHVVLWLIKDFAWIAGYKLLGLIMAGPTVALSMVITWIFRKERSGFFHYLAISFWITGNVIWMIGEFYFQDSLRNIAKPMFYLGFLVIGYYYLFKLVKPLKEKGPSKTDLSQPN